MYTQQWIDEYLEPEEHEVRPRKPIPIRSKSEFLPAVFEFEAIENETPEPKSPAVEADAVASLKIHPHIAQAEVDDVVRLVEIDSTTPPASDSCAETLCHPALVMDTNWSALDHQESHTSNRIENERSSAAKKRTVERLDKEITPIRVPHRRSVTNEHMALVRPKTPVKRSKHPGFWIGCAMGSAAAAVLLLAVRFAVGTM